MSVVVLLGLLVKITFIFKLLADKKINQNY
ncbi:hypothetical protein NGDEOPKE_00200 [Enterococcus phage vB_OCPT_Carl]|uniref:Uncharacterized protein n=1 Tax=Enterococcus phage vB_OCPT_Car TaxID=2922319 RepID=A0A9E7DUE7_9CAUD|nr:hypothetical protein NGDEOPKE_00200 [Enterococcus phage vB_OCPT_Carl]UQT00163.1 hypothetical protein EGEOBHOM_00004 [Enterococcus phage vB_OCPT_Car]